jgi:hypothetical protein
MLICYLSKPLLIPLPFTSDGSRAHRFAPTTVPVYFRLLLKPAVPMSISYACWKENWRSRRNRFLKEYCNFERVKSLWVIVFGRLSLFLSYDLFLNYLWGPITCFTLASDYIALSRYRILWYSRRPFVLLCDKTLIRLQHCSCFQIKRNEYYQFLVA